VNLAVGMRAAFHSLLGLTATILLASCRTATGPQFEPHAGTSSSPAVLNDFTPVAGEGRPDPGLLQPPVEPFTLGPGDRLEIQIIGDATTITTTVVGPDGRLYFYLLPGLDVWGLTLGEAKSLIERELLKFLRDKPRVSVTLRGVESQQVWLLGRLNHPGVYPIIGPTRLLEAFALAGGPTSPATLASLANGPMGANLSEDLADLRRGFVVREGKIVPVDLYRLLKEGDMSQDIYLHPGDLVYVPPAVAREVFVLGAVLEPRSVAYRKSLSLVAAVASARGTIKDAYLSHVAIVRGSLSEPKIAVVDFRAITRGQKPDVLLEPGDIVYVPFAPYRTLERYANMILNTFVSTVAINEGARSVSRNVVPVGVSIGGGSGGSVPTPVVVPP